MHNFRQLMIACLRLSVNENHVPAESLINHLQLYLKEVLKTMLLLNQFDEQMKVQIASLACLSLNQVHLNIVM